MRKSTKVLKRLLSLFLVVLISINSYAAIVGDNDGAAFVTKAEFDSLRNTFDDQINQYNSSIDNKIDGAIGSYLAGVKTNDKPYIMLDDIKGAVGRDLRFQNKKGLGADCTTRYIVTKEKSYSLDFSDAEKRGWKSYDFTNMVNNGGGDIYVNGPMIAWSTSSTNPKTLFVYVRVDKKPVFSTSLTFNPSNSYRSYICFLTKGKWSWPTSGAQYKLIGTKGTAAPSDGNAYSGNGFSAGYLFNKTWYKSTYDPTKQEYLVIDYNADSAPSDEILGCAISVNNTTSTYNSSSGVSDVQVKNLQGTWNFVWLKTAETEKKHYIFSSDWTQAGAGQAWISMDLANGKKMLLGRRNIYPMVVLHYSSKWYKAFGEVTKANNVFDYTTAHSHTITPPTSWTFVRSGTRYSSYNTTDNAFWYQIMTTLYQDTMMDKYVQTDQWSDDFGNALKHVDLYVLPSAGSAVGSSLTWAQTTPEIEGFTHKLGAVNMTMNGIKITLGSSNMDTFEHLYLTGIAGEVVYMGGGAPLMRMRAEQSTEYTINMDLLTRNSSGTAAQDGVTVRLSYQQFKDGNFVTTTDKIYEKSFDTDSSGKRSISFDISGIPKDSIIWYSLKPNAAWYTAECTKCTAVIK